MTRVQKSVRMMLKMTKSPTPSQVRVLLFIHSRIFFLFQSYVLFILAAYFYSSRSFYSLIKMLINNFIHVFNFQMDSPRDPLATGGRGRAGSGGRSSGRAGSGGRSSG